MQIGCRGQRADSLFQVAHREGRARFEVFEYVNDWLVSEDTQTASQQRRIPDAVRMNTFQERRNS
jgi:hypothetical protein